MTKPTSRSAAQRKPANRKLVSNKLTDAQRMILAGAAQRDDGAATLAEGMTEKAAHKLADALIQNGLAREIRAKSDMPVWRRNEEGRACALVVTKRGRVAIKGDDDRQAVDAVLEAPAPSSISSAACSIGSAACSQTAASSQIEPNTPRHGSKLADVMALLGRKQGAGIEELTSITGWLPHTTRAALTGLRKRGFTIDRLRSEQGGSVYRIVIGAAPALAA
jgi:hypothetical protein